MRSIFDEAAALNQDVGSWDVRSMTDMEEMFEDATAFSCWDLGMGDVSYYSGESAVVDPFYVGIHTIPQGSEYTDGVCACPVGSVLEEDMGNNGVCTVVPSAFPCAPLFSATRRVPDIKMVENLGCNESLREELCVSIALAKECLSVT
jgi:hypothetical protein